MTAASHTVLVVEDDRFLRRACEAGLRQHGFTVVTATNGEDALRRVRESMPDLILLDLLMPGLSGIEVLKVLKSSEATSTIPVVILSNSSREEDKQLAADLGATGYFIKANLSLTQLAGEIARQLEGVKS